MDNTILNLIDGVNIKTKSNTYYNSDGISVPRVTEILSATIHSDGLMYWANNLGLKGLRYKTELDKAANAGTITHSKIEQFLKEKIEDTGNIGFSGFLLWYKTLTEVLDIPVEVIDVERRLVCKYFGGTLDALLKIGDTLYLVDFKTSNHVTFKYFLQLAAYRYMLALEGIYVNGVIVLQVDKQEIGFNEYILNFSNPEHLLFMDECERCFFSLVYAFYNTEYIKERFKEVVSK